MSPVRNARVCRDGGWDAAAARREAQVQVQVNDEPDAAGGLPQANPLAMAGLQLRGGTGVAEISTTSRAPM